MHNPQITVKRSLQIFCGSLVTLTLLAWGISFICSRFLRLGYPFNTPLYDPAALFSDLTDYYSRMTQLNQGAEILSRGVPQFNYPAPAVYVFAFFICTFRYPVVALIGFTASAGLVALLVLRRKLAVPGANPDWINATLAATALCSYPFLIVMNRANLDGVVWFFSFLGLVFLIRRQYLISALFFAATVCVKPFPALFFFFFLRDRRYKELGIAVAAICAANLAALKTLGPTVAVAYQALQKGVHTYFDNYVVAFRNQEEIFDHSAFSCVKQLIRVLIGPHRQFVSDSHLLTAYIAWVPTCVLIVIGSGFYFWRKPKVNQLFAVVILILLLPPVSADYTLTELYLPWGVFMIFLVGDVGSGRVKFSLRDSLWILIPCAILVTPQSYLTFAGVGFAGQVKAVVLMVLLYVVARIDMPSSLFYELPSADAKANETDLKREVRELPL